MKCTGVKIQHSAGYDFAWPVNNGTIPWRMYYGVANVLLVLTGTENFCDFIKIPMISCLSVIF